MMPSSFFHPKFSSHKPARRHWLWLFAVLLPMALFGVIRERRSWQPICIPISGEPLYRISWLDDNLVSVSTDPRTIIVVSAKKRAVWKRFKAQTTSFSLGKANLSDDKNTLLVGSRGDSPIDIMGQVLKIDFATGLQRGSFEGNLYSYVLGSKLFTYASGIPKKNPPTWNARLKKNIPSVDLLTYYSLIYDWKTERLLSNVHLDIRTALNNNGPQTNHIEVACWMRDGQQVVIQIGNGICVFDSSSGKFLKTLQKRGHTIGPLALSRDGKRLGYAERLGISKSIIHIWDTTNWKELTAFTPHNNPGATMLELSPDGNNIALFGNWESHVTKSILLLNWQTQTLQREIKGEQAAVNLSFSPDGCTLATTNESGVITLYRVK